VTKLHLLTSRLVLGVHSVRYSAREEVSRQEGQALIEYALIISLIALVAIIALQTTGTNVKGLLNKIAGDV
jgi:Flp pilus assembly pilin Flp